VPGVRDADGQVIERLATSRVTELARESAISGGMLPKLEACLRALDGGVRAVRIMPAARVETLSGLADGSLRDGTEVVIQ